MYTTNVIEAINWQYRKVIKAKGVFPSDTSLEKCFVWRARMSCKSGRNGIGLGSGAEPAVCPLYLPP